MNRHVWIAVVLTATVAAFVFPAAGFAQTVAVTDPVDAPPAIDGNPHPDLASVTVTQDEAANTATVAVGFHSATFATAGGSLVSAYLPLALGKASGASCDYSVAGSPDFAVSFSAASAYGSLEVVGSTGKVAYDPAPAWNAERTQLTWTMTNAAFATSFDCLAAGPLYGDTRSYAAHPDSRYSSGCDCWTVFGSIDDMGDTGAGATGWFPGREPRATIKPKWTAKPLMVTQTASLAVAATGALGTNADVRVTWYRGSARFRVESRTVQAGSTATFKARLMRPGVHRVVVSTSSGVVFSQRFNVARKIAKPNLKAPLRIGNSGTYPRARQKITYRVCGPRGRLRTNVRGTYGAGGQVWERLTLNFQPFHRGGCRQYVASWRVTDDWYGVGQRNFYVQVFDRFGQASVRRKVGFYVVD